MSSGHGQTGCFRIKTSLIIIPRSSRISAPLFALLGERADIVKAMRWTMVPIAGLILAMTYLTGVRLFSPRVGLWGALLTATFPGFYFETGEYRPDVLWTALWLITLAILTAGKPHPRRLFAAGLTFGIAFAVSMKTTFLALTLLTASVAVWLLRFAVPGSRSSPKMSGYHVIASFLAPVAGAYRSALCCRVLCLEWCAETDVLVTGVGRPLDSFCFRGGEDTKRNFKHAKRQSSSETTRVVQATIGHLSYTIRNGRKFTSSRRNLAI
jgi:hypothetical protein